MQLVLEPVICHYIRRPTSWASMDRINFTLHNFVSLDLQSRIHIVRLRWLNCGSELQCWGMLYCGMQWIVCVVHTKDCQWLCQAGSVWMVLWQLETVTTSLVQWKFRTSATES